MKRDLILIRHTKSSWNDPLLTDFERPINRDRTADPENIARRLKELGLHPQLILCSPAKRTRQTVAYFCETLKYDSGKVSFDKRLYESSAEDYLEVLRETEPAVKTAIIVGHNPSTTHLANLFLTEKIFHVPTTGVVWLEIDAPDWQFSFPVHSRLKYFLTPKTLNP